jgi:histidinol phosphatase-like PHP family hydrolase
VEEIAVVVSARGVRPSVSDHLSRDVRGAVDSDDGVRTYLDELDRHDVLRGGEFCWHDTLWRELPADLLARFTHCIGSLHGVFLPGGRIQHMFSRSFPEGLGPTAYLEHHVANAERLATEMPVDILAHPTLLPLALRALPPEEVWTEPLEERVVAALAAGGIAFELSNRYRPHERIVRRAVAAGVRISLGSDGHAREQVGDVAYPLALARRYGVRDADLYDPVVHGSRAPT